MIQSISSVLIRGTSRCNGRTTIYLGPADNPILRLAVGARRRPCPEYLLYARRSGVALVGFNPFGCGFDRDRLDDAALLALPLGKYMRECNHQVGAIIAATDHIGYMAARFLGSVNRHVPLHVITHGFLLNDLPRMRFLASCPNLRFLCLSHSIQQKILGGFDVPEGRVLNTGYGVDVRFFRPRPTESRYVFSAGAAQRDYPTLVRAVQGLAVPVRIAADSAWNSYPLAVHNVNLPRNVIIGSCGNYRNLRRFYADAAAVIVPLYDVPRACGYAVISEAMSMGKVVVATKTQCASDFIVEGDTGYYVEPGDVTGLRRQIEAILDDPETADRMGSRARARIDENFSLEEYCRRLEAATICQ